MGEWEKWTVFLHPAQRAYAERDYSGPARISGSAGTGKTIVALHRAVHLARRHPESSVLLTTFSKTLANALRTRLDRLVGNEPDIYGRITVHSIAGVAQALYTELFGEPVIASSELVGSLLKLRAEKVAGHRFSVSFLFGEWTDIVDAWQLRSWEDYRDVPRLGRKTRIGGKQREMLWSIFEGVRAELGKRGLVSWPDVFGRLTAHFDERRKGACSPSWTTESGRR